MDLMASWVWKNFEGYVRNHLEPWVGTSRFKALARLCLPR